MIIDVNAHWYPDNFFSDKEFFNACLRAIPRAYGEHVDMSDMPGTDKKLVNISRPKGHYNVNLPTEPPDLDDWLRDMDTAKVDKSILRWCIWPEWATLEICRKVNDAMARTVKEHPDRFLGIATVPPWGDKDCLDELDRCIDELGCIGVQISAHYGTLYLDSEEFRPYFKRINELKIPVLVHHTSLPVDYGHVYEYDGFRRVVGRCIDQITSVGRIMFSGMLDEFPNLKLIHTMMAGGLFAYSALITPAKSRVASDMERFDPAASDKVKGYLKNNIYSDITHALIWSKAQLECAVKDLGADHVLFGSSYPLRREWLLYGPEYIESLDISREEKALVLGESAANLFNIKG